MKTVSIHDAKTNLSKYIAAAKKGEPIYIGGFGKPEVVLSKITTHDIIGAEYRNFAIAKGKVSERHDAFTARTDHAIAAMMYEENKKK